MKPPFSDSAEISAFVLTGGKSTRMGMDKASLEIDGEIFLSRAIRLLQSVSSTVAVVGSLLPPASKPGSIPVLADAFPGYGPLGGIATALANTRTDWNLIVACDLPYLTFEWLQFLTAHAVNSRAEVVMPESERGLEPLCAMYRRDIQPRVATALHRGVRKVTDGLADCRMETVARAGWKSFDAEGRLFKNVNTPEDYAEARALLGRGAKP
jgi:molybdopterin-guanine dinucleotide biosynthesis protein A